MTAKCPRTLVEAEVERVFGMSPDVERLSFLPMPVAPFGPDGERDFSKAEWTAPQLLYDLARAFVTPGVAAGGNQVSDEDGLNLALAVTGGSSFSRMAGQKVLGNSGEILASRGAKVYNGPVTKRPFSADYPDVQGRYDAAGNLTHDIDGNPLEVGGRIVGRSVVGGADQALSPTEFDAIAKEGTGRNTQVVPPSKLGRSGRDLGNVEVNRYTRLPEEVGLSNKLTPDDLPGVYGHEIGHVIDQLAGEIPTEGLTRELKALYDAGNNPNRAHGNPDMPAKWAQRHRPEDAGYKGEDIPREWMAEAIRIYMANPGYLKDAAPKTAAAIRKAVNADPAIRKIIQFNMGGTPMPSVLPPDTNADTDPSALPPGYVYGKNFI